MMTTQEHAVLRATLAAMRKQRVQSDYGLIPASVDHLEKLLATTAAEGERAVLYALIFSECSKAQNDRLYVGWLHRGVRDFPNEPQFHIDLAFGLATTEPKQREAALVSARKALELAKAQDRLVRYCATNLARIALMLDDYDTLTHALEELIADAGAKRPEDTGYEFDFVRQIDVRRVDAGVLERYKDCDKGLPIDRP